MLVLLIIVVSEVKAQAVCGKRSEIVKQLESIYREVRHAYGVDAYGNLVEIFTSRNNNWTLMLTNPGGLTCLFRAGHDWTHVAKGDHARDEF